MRKNTLIADNQEIDGVNQMKSMLLNFGMNHLFLSDMYINKQEFGILNIPYSHDIKYENPLYLLINLANTPQVAKLRISLIFYNRLLGFVIFDSLK